MYLRQILAGITTVVALSGASLLSRSYYFFKTPSTTNASPSLEGLVDQGHRSLRLADYKTISLKTKSKDHTPDYVSGSLATTAKRCENPITNIPQEYFKSQSKEDEKLLGWFKSFCGGTYLELGGLDGVTYSNSYVFNNALGWKGVLIELKNENYQKLVVNRPNEIAAIHAGVCNWKQTLHEVSTGNVNNAVGGIWEFSAPSFREQWWKGITLDSPDVKEVECDSLDNLLLTYAPQATVFNS